MGIPVENLTTPPSALGEGSTPAPPPAATPPATTPPASPDQTPPAPPATPPAAAPEPTTTPKAQDGGGKAPLFGSQEEAEKAYRALGNTHQNKMATLNAQISQLEQERDAVRAQLAEFKLGKEQADGQVATLTTEKQTAEQLAAEAKAQTAYYQLLATEFNDVAPLAIDLQATMGPAFNATEEELRAAFGKLRDTMGEAAAARRAGQAAGATQPTPPQAPNTQAKSEQELIRLMTEASRKGDRESFQKWNQMLINQHTGPTLPTSMTE